jgi:hypothetical protein
MWSPNADQSIAISGESKRKIMQFSKWGNSQAIRLSASAVEGLKLREGDGIEVPMADGRAFQPVIAGWSAA